MWVSDPGAPGKAKLNVRGKTLPHQPGIYFDNKPPATGKRPAAAEDLGRSLRKRAENRSVAPDPPKMTSAKPAAITARSKTLAAAAAVKNKAKEKVRMAVAQAKGPTAKIGGKAGAQSKGPVLTQRHAPDPGHKASIPQAVSTSMQVFAPSSSLYFYFALGVWMKANDEKGMSAPCVILKVITQPRVLC